MTRDIASLREIADIAAELAELRESADDILRQAWAVERTRKLLDGPDPAFDEKLWDTITGLGWPDVLVTDSRGGGGGSLRELCVLTEAAGAAALPIPLASNAAAAWAEDRCTEGVVVLLDAVGATVDGEAMTGSWPVVPFGAVATRLLALGDRDGEPVLGVVDPAGPGVHREALRPLDHNPAAAITLESAPVAVVFAGIEATRRHEQAKFRADLAAVAELIGIAAAANAAAVEYAKVRVAFGRPIGTFQAIKHRLVDQRSVIEVARALVNRAADAAEHDQPDTEALVSLAVFWAIDSLRRVPEGATQVFGGVAYTWEHEAHVHLRRAATRAAALGPRRVHRDIVARWLAARGGAQR